MLQCLEATETYMKGVLSFTDEELVSADFIHNVQLGTKHQPIFNVATVVNSSIKPWTTVSKKKRSFEVVTLRVTTCCTEEFLHLRLQGHLAEQLEGREALLQDRVLWRQ